MNDDQPIRCSSFEGVTNTFYTIHDDPWDDPRLYVPLDGEEEDKPSITWIGVVIAVFALLITALMYLLSKI